MSVSVQVEDFDVAREMNNLRLGQTDVGAIALFVGCVRDLNEGLDVSAMTLEHYPEMTQRCLEAIVVEAKARFEIKEARVIHRVGTLYPTDQIVMVAVSSKHRGQAFDACEFIMDYLKTQAPFWKKENTPQGNRWVESRDSDTQAALRWSQAEQS